MSYFFLFFANKVISINDFMDRMPTIKGRRCTIFSETKNRNMKEKQIKALDSFKRIRLSRLQKISHFKTLEDEEDI